ncbi:hypothetical protein BN185_460004 [Clostridioides difficile E28]|nr:hypothetical protein BN184_510004 [Clostridioides difficile T3]CCL74626.1 hypothetical protein BN185_460004 [Clostridioides difficile E28]
MLLPAKYLLVLAFSVYRFYDCPQTVMLIFVYDYHRVLLCL